MENNNDNLTFKLNIIKSPLDNRDWIIKNNNLRFPSSLDYRFQLQPIRNQGSQGTCYAQSAACMKEWQEKKDYGFDFYFSPQFFYNHRPNNYDQNDNNDEGMFGRDVMKLLMTIGICSEQQYPYGRIESKDDIDIQLKQEALQHRIKNFARIETIDSLKYSLYQNGPCLIAFPVFNYGMEMWKPQFENQATSGGHAMTVVGYTSDSFIIRNSWGYHWGDKGYCYYKFEDWGSHWEIWTTVDEKTELKDPNSDDNLDINNFELNDVKLNDDSEDQQDSYYQKTKDLIFYIYTFLVYFVPKLFCK